MMLDSMQYRAPVARRSRKDTMAALHPNPGVQTAYRKQLDLLIGEMHNSIVYWMESAYRNNEPTTLSEDALGTGYEPPSPMESAGFDSLQGHQFAMDDTPATVLRRIMQALARRWKKNLNAAAPELAQYFATSVKDRVDGTLKTILKKNGLAVKFTMTDEARDVLAATTGENISLIKSIGEQYLSDVEQAVMRSVAQGRDLKSLFDEIGHKVDLKRIKLGRKPGESDKSLLARTRRRAALIARDQNNKATATIQRVRQQGLGITQAVWLHSGGGKHPREEHEQWGKERARYDVAKGMWSDVDKCYVWPGTAINCRCVAMAVIPGLEDELGMDAAPTFIESQHPRDENGKFAKVSNGHTQPKQGTPTRDIWNLADKISNEQNSHATSKQVEEAAAKAGYSPITAANQYKHWKKFHGVGKKPVTSAPAVPSKPSPAPAQPVPKAVQPPIGQIPETASGKLADLDAQLQGGGFDSEGVFNGIHYWKNAGGKVRVSYKPDTGTYQVSRRTPGGNYKWAGSGAGYLNALNAAFALQEIMSQLPEQVAKPPVAKLPPKSVVKTKSESMPVSGGMSYNEHGVPKPHHLPSNIQKSLKSYTGAAYRAINQALRTGNADFTDGDQKAKIQNIEKAFAETPPLKQDVVVRRGIDFSALKEMCAQAGLKDPLELTPGHVLHDKGFVSTTHNKYAGFGNAKIEITVPAGAKAIYPGGISHHPSEDETLLPAGTKFIIEKIDMIEEKKIGKIHVRVAVNG